MYKIKILSRAIDSITSIVDYIAKDNLFYANQVQDYIYKSIRLLEEYPFIWPELDKKYRSIVESKYKFKIVYRISGKTVFIVWIYREQKSWK
ncbi:MAG: hypothetical protein ACD_78C00070G0005 [uncultured bacterium (gcode 4)]|uniref:Plasmid stabilization system n=1 Tax=uncultured bacterium (gcode 4) TaxID=1234023 RepID=K1YY93_9BACT|nr:MAG: hypothetical protein ACD_78C00070G0005 [uncultured bacterium (gcode 4)]